MTERIPETQTTVTGDVSPVSPFRYLEAIEAPVLVLDENGVIAWLNTACQSLLGYSQKEVTGEVFWDRLIVPECSQRARQFYKILHGRQCTLDMLTKKGDRLLVRWHNCRVPDDSTGSGHIVITAPDYYPGLPLKKSGKTKNITGRRFVESALQESESRFRTLFESAAEFIFLIDPDGRILLTNRYVREQSGFREEEIEGRNIKEFFTHRSKQICDCNFPVLKERGYNRAEVEFVCKDGRVLEMECSATAVPDKRNEFSSFLIIQRDVTERNRAAEALLDIERRFRAIFNSTFQFIGLLDPAGKLLEANQAALDFVGLLNEEVVGKYFWETAWWGGSKKEQDRLKEGIRRAARGELVRYETRNYGKDRKVADVDFSLKPVANERGEIVLIIPEGRDISERKRAEEQLRRNQLESAHLMRLSIMGEMAAGMAHELNQPLAALISYCGTALSIARQTPAVPEELSTMLEYATEQTHRSSEIIKHIRHFVSKESVAKTPVRIDRVIVEMFDFIEWELRNCEFRVVTRLHDEDRLVLANRVQIEQVLLNLVRNSIEAIQSGGIGDGRIFMETGIVSGDRIRITIRDNGPGIDPGMKKKLFEPFQTTKPTGMGMGLSVCRTIVQDHSGKIWFEDRLTGGAEFSIELPAMDEAIGA